MYGIDDLIARALDYLEEEGHSSSSVAHHRATWRRVRAWCAASGTDRFDRRAEAAYLEEAGLLGDGLTKHWRSERSRVGLLLSLAETGRPPVRAARRRYRVPKGLEAAYRSYAEELAARGLKPVTRSSYLCTVRGFADTCGAARPADLGAPSVRAYTEAISGCAPQTRSAKLCVVRDFLRFLAGAGMCGDEAARAIPVVPGNKRSALPSAYTHAELSPALERFPRSLHPRRDRAIVLLASVLGMRAGDIRGLRLSDIDWRSRTVSYVQSKTRVANTLPMPDEVALAVADYLMGERPDVDDDRVFISSRAPYRAIGSTHTFHRMVTRALADAGVETAGRHHGMHSLRHSAATGMLAEGTPYPTISSVLGHSSVNVTGRYLSVDVESLRPLALEVPTCPR